MSEQKNDDRDAEVTALRARVAELERKVSWLSYDVRQKDAALADATASLRMVQVDPGLAWRWQGDGHDDPASLSCPVIMTADTLRGFVADRARVTDLEAQLAGAPDRTMLDSLRELEERLERLSRDGKSALATLDRLVAAAPAGLRVAALLAEIDDLTDAAVKTANASPFAADRNRASALALAYANATTAIRQHLGEPTPTERAAAEVLAHDASDVIPSATPRILDEIAMEIEQAREYLGFARADRAGYRIARIARLALAGIVYCDAAKGGAQ